MEEKRTNEVFLLSCSLALLKYWSSSAGLTVLVL